MPFCDLEDLPLSLTVSSSIAKSQIKDFIKNFSSGSINLLLGHSVNNVKFLNLFKLNLALKTYPLKIFNKKNQIKIICLKNSSYSNPQNKIFFASLKNFIYI